MRNSDTSDDVKGHNSTTCVHAKSNFAWNHVKTNEVNSLEKLQDSRDHLCDGVHGRILVTTTHTHNSDTTNERDHINSCSMKTQMCT